MKVDETVLIFAKKIELKTKIFEALSNHDIYNCLRQMNVKTCLGVILKENIDKVVEDTSQNSENFSLIFNLDNSDGPGSHWVSLFVSSKNIYYFDSFSDAYPLESLKMRGYTVFRNLDRYQDMSSPPICGHLCIAFCYLCHITRGDVDRVLKEMKNDMVLRWVCHNLTLLN